MKNKLLIFLLPAWLLFSCDEGNSADEESQGNGAIAVDVVIVEPQIITDRVNTSGSLRPWETATLKARAAGNVIDISFEEGDRVTKGQKLVQLDDRTYRAQLRRLKADLQNAERELERNKKLREVNGISQRELDDNINRAEMLKAEIDEIEVMIDFTAIKAPFDGQIGLRNISPGDYLSVGESVAQIAQEDKLRLEFTVPEQYTTSVKRSDTVQFKIRGQDSTFYAQIYGREAQVSVESRTLRVRALVENEDRLLMPGAFAKVFVNTAVHKNALLVPSESVTSNIRGQTVWKFKNGKADNVEVQPGLRLSKTTQILSGVQQGDTVLTTGLLQVREGVPVTVKKIMKIEQRN